MRLEFGDYIKPEQAHRLTSPMMFFRDNKSVDYIANLSKETNFKIFKDEKKYNIQMDIFDYIDESNGCIESCEVFA